MASTARKKKAEKRMRELLAQENLPQPDEVEYGFSCVRLFWLGRKTVVVVDVDDDGEIGPSHLERNDREPHAELEPATNDNVVVEFPTRGRSTKHRKLRPVHPDEDQWFEPF
jgi:hypothetical protein